MHIIYNIQILHLKTLIGLLLTIFLSPLLAGVNNNLVLTQCDQVLPSAAVTVKSLSASEQSYSLLSCDTVPVI